MVLGHSVAMLSALGTLLSDWERSANNSIFFLWEKELTYSVFINCTNQKAGKNLNNVDQWSVYKNLQWYFIFIKVMADRDDDNYQVANISKTGKYQVASPSLLFIWQYPRPLLLLPSAPPPFLLPTPPIEVASVINLSEASGARC